MKPGGTVNRPPRPGGTVTQHPNGLWLPARTPPAGPRHLAPVPAGTVNRPTQPAIQHGADTLFAHFAGAGTLTTAIFPKHRATPALGGEGTLDVVTIPRVPLPASFGGAGELSLLIETVGGDPARDIPFTGAGVLTADAFPRMDAGTAPATASGTLTAAAIPLMDAEGVFYTSDGTLTVASSPRYAVAAAFAGAGGLAASVVSTAQVSAPFAGAGALSVVSLPRHIVTTGTSGAGALAVTRGRGWDDQLTRANASNLGGSGTTWVQGGSGSGIGVTSNASSWGNGGGTDGDAYAIRAEDLLTNDQYIRVVVSTASSTRASRLLLQCNSGSTAHAYLNWFSNAIYFGRSTGAYPGSITDMGSATSGISIGNGTVIEFYNAGSVYKVDMDGVNKITVDDTGATIARSSSTRRVGFGQSRSTFANSGFILEWQGRDRLANAA